MMLRCALIAVITVSLWTTTVFCQGVKPEIIAHRGASFDAPENTLAAFKAAWKQNADGVDCSGEDAIDAAFVKTIRRGSFEFHVWTIDEADKARRFASLGVDSIATNRPQWIREQLAKPQGKGEAK